MKFALTLAALLAASMPASAGIGNALQPQPWTYFNQPTMQVPSYQPPQWTPPPTWNQPLQPPQRLQTTCYLIGNILTCY
jgi:hypothetical protein